MDTAGATRRVALEAVEDVDPEGLGTRLRDRIEATSTVPGVLVVRCTEASQEHPLATPQEPFSGAVAERVAGVQLVYVGLDQTRELAREEPWKHETSTASAASSPGSDATADLDILVADVLVARGVNLLARTPAAKQAVRTVQAFGRDQTVRRSTGDAALDANLEADVLELAVVAGATAGDSTAGPGLREFAADLAADVSGSGGYPPAAAFFPENVTERLSALVAEPPASDGVPTFVDD